MKQRGPRRLGRKNSKRKDMEVKGVWEYRAALSRGKRSARKRDNVHKVLSSGLLQGDSVNTSYSLYRILPVGAQNQVWRHSCSVSTYSEHLVGTVYDGGYNGVTAAFIELTVQWGHQHEINRHTNKPILRNCDKRFEGHAPSVTRESVKVWGVAAQWTNSK